MCNCGCQAKKSENGSPAPQGDKKSYICYQCNTFKESPTGTPPPECCGKKMQEVD